MSFNPDSTKQAQEAIFCLYFKIHSTLHVTSTKQMSNKTPFKKHLDLILDNQLSFAEHLKTIFNEVNKTIGLIRKLENSLLFSLLRNFLHYSWLSVDLLLDLILTLEISFTTSQSIILFKTKLKVSNITHESGTSREIFYEKLGLESLQHCCWYRKLCYLYKIVFNKSPNYLFKVVPFSYTIYILIYYI